MRLAVPGTWSSVDKTYEAQGGSQAGAAPPWRRRRELGATGAIDAAYEMIEGDDRVEDLIFADAPRFFRFGSPVIRIQGGRWWITGIHFVGGPFQIANNPDTNVAFDRCLFSSDPQALLGWWKGTAVLEVFGDRSSHLWTPDRAVVRAQQEVLTALFESPRALEKNVSVADYIANYRE